MTSWIPTFQSLEFPLKPIDVVRGRSDGIATCAVRHRAYKALVNHDVIIIDAASTKRRKLESAAGDRKLTRSRDSQPSAADLAYRCKMRIGPLAPMFSDSGPRTEWASESDRTRDAERVCPCSTWRQAKSLLRSDSESLKNSVSLVMSARRIDRQSR